MSKHSALSKFFIFSFIAVVSVSCSNVNFEVEKNAFLKTASVMDQDFDESDGEVVQPEGDEPGDDASDEVEQPDQAEVPPFLGVPGEIEQPIDRICSDSRSAKATNFKTAMADPVIPVELRLNDQVCSTDKARINELVMAPSISIADLQALCPGVVPANGRISLSLAIDGEVAKVPGSKKKFAFLYAKNKTTTGIGASDENCGSRHSPLVIHRASDPQFPLPIALSSQKAGVDFDLLGASNNHEKVRISWFTNFDYGLLVLPNKEGQVEGINELFGDNTMGPDGKAASNGYAALAKYDGKSADGSADVGVADQFINVDDPVFSRLRLWTDLNLDGECQWNEMISLQEAGIVFVDLRYSSDYSEIDQYGNETTMKSVVGLEDGSLDLIFDLWFAIR